MPRWQPPFRHLSANAAPASRARRLALLALALAAPVARADGVRRASAPAHGDTGLVFHGRASYYGRQFIGRPTASGERYDPTALTMAHRGLPFGAWVRVTNLHNQHSVVVRVNDRGPFTRHRVADLSHGAARLLRMTVAGVVPARFEVLAGPPADASDTPLAAPPAQPPAEIPDGRGGPAGPA